MTKTHADSHFLSRSVPLVQKTDEYISKEKMEAASQALLSVPKKKTAFEEMSDLLDKENTANSQKVRELIRQDVTAEMNKNNEAFKKNLIKDFEARMQKNIFGGLRTTSPGRAPRKK